jgi:hypothetical protein
MRDGLARIPVTIKLTAGKDDDLIDWLASLPKGTRQAVIKDMLREAVKRSRQEANSAALLTQIGQDTAWLRATLSEMPTWMEGVLSRLVVSQAPDSLQAEVKPTRTGQLSTAGVTRREKRIAKATW